MRGFGLLVAEQVMGASVAANSFYVLAWMTGEIPSMPPSQVLGLVLHAVIFGTCAGLLFALKVRR